MSNLILLAAGEDEVPRAESVYATEGTYTWVCPEGVTSVSVVCVGAGGGGCRAITAIYIVGSQIQKN